MFVVMHDGTLGERAVPDGRGGVVIARPGIPFEVSDEVAGVAPGPWETCESDVPRGDDGEDLVGTHAFEQLEAPVEVGDGVVHYWRRRHLGSGLLAQVDVFEAAAGAAGTEGEL